MIFCCIYEKNITSEPQDLHWSVCRCLQCPVYKFPGTLAEAGELWGSRAACWGPCFGTSPRMELPWLLGCDGVLVVCFWDWGFVLELCSLKGLIHELSILAGQQHGAKANIPNLTLNQTGAFCGAAVHVLYQPWRQCGAQGRISSSGQTHNLSLSLGALVWFGLLFCFLLLGFVIFFGGSYC